MNGTFTGKASLNKMDSKFPCYTNGKTKNGDKYQRFNLAVTDDKNNRAMLELFGMVQKEIKTMNTDNEKISIAWDDRDDQAIVNTVASYKKNTFSFVDDERKEFISTYDAVGYLHDHEDELKDKKIGVTCQVEKNIYNGKVSNRYIIKNIYPIDEEKKVPTKLKITGDFFFNKDSIDISEWKEEKKLILNGYTQAYVSDKKKTMYFPETIVFDCGKVDFDNEDHVNMVKFKLSCINCDLKDGKISTKLKSSTMYKIGVELRYINSAQEVEFDESMLTDKQRLAISLGLKDISQFQGNKVFGERVTEFKVTDFQIEREAYSDGCIDMEIKPSEFEEDVYRPDDEETEDILDGAINSPEESDPDNGEDLFS